MAESVMQRSFAAGELAPALHARADLAKYVTGLRTCKNFFVRKEGGISNRAGFRYVATIKESEEAILMRFVSETIGASVLIEVGDGYFRFFLNGAPVELAGVTAWSGATAYVPGDLASRAGVNYYCILAHTNQQPPAALYWYAMPTTLLEIPHGFGAHQPNWHQSGHVITLTHGEVAPAELEYQSLTRWILRPISTAPWHVAPTTPAGTEGAAGTRTFKYVVTAAKAETYEETVASAVITLLTAAEPTPDAPHALTWDAVTGAAEYYVYGDPYENGVYGFLGTAASNSFKDTGLIPDFAVTPPIARVLFNAASEYPNCSTTCQQRRVFASTGNNPDQIDLSRTGFPSNFGITSPLQDDDAIRVRLAGRGNHAVRWLVGLTDLVVGAASAVWRMRGPGGGPITPSDLDAKENVFAGAHDKAPVVTGNTVVYLQARGKIVRDVRFDQQVEGLGGRDLTVFATHLFESTFARLDYAETPHSIVWAVRNDGVLLGMTYLPDQEVFGWHRHETQGGAIEDVCVIPEAGEDVVYVIVARTIDGDEVRYLERLESRLLVDFDEDCFFVDSGLTYEGAAADEISGLDHLEGEIVAVLGDGAVLFNGDPDAADAESFRVTDGAITLPVACEVVHVGLPIRFADAELLDLDVQGASVRDHKKRVGSVTLLLDKSSRGFLIGPDDGHLTADVSQVWDAAVDEFTGQIEVPVPAEFGNYGRVLIRQPNPLPLTVLGVIPNVELGG